MKKLLFSFVVFTVLLFIGCQENSITDPVSNNTNLNLATSEQSFLDKDIISSYPGVIKLEGTLFDPSHYFNNYAAISGFVRYSLDKVILDRIPEDTPIKVRLYVNAELKEDPSGQYSKSLFVNGASEDYVYKSAPNDPVYYLEKSFSVKKNPLNLVFKFQVDEKSLTLISMRLVKRSELPIPDPEM
jgi:hypothetical protein